MNPPSWLTILALSSLIFLAAAWLITSVCRLSAAWNHLCWLIALAMPILSLIVIPSGLHIKLPVLPAPHGSALPVHAQTSDPIPFPSEPAVSPAVSARSASPAETSHRAHLGTLWACGGLLVLGYLALSHLSLKIKMRLSRKVPVPQRISTAAAVAARGLKAEILLSDFSEVPFCYGIFRRRIVLPLQAAEWSAETLQACLAHEFAHLRRHDLLSLTLAQLACAAVWFNPFAWLGLSRLRAAAEFAADDLALGNTGTGETYASQLLTIAERLRVSPSPIATFPMARPGQLRLRIDALMDDRRRRSSPGARGVLSIAGALTILFTIGLAVDLVAAESKPDAMQTASAPLPPIQLSWTGEFHEDAGFVIATGDVRLRWQGLRAQADRLEYDRKNGRLRLSAKDSRNGRFETTILVRLRAALPDIVVAPQVERQPDLPGLNLPGGSSTPDGEHATAITSDGESKKDGDLFVAKDNAIISVNGIAAGADILEYDMLKRSASLYRQPASGDRQLTATATITDVKTAVYNFAEEYIAAVKTGNKAKLRTLLGAGWLPGASGDEKKALDSWLAASLDLQSALARSQTISVTPWSESPNEQPQTWPLRPAYRVQVFGTGPSASFSIFETSGRQLAVVFPLPAGKETPFTQPSIASSTPGIPDHRLSSPPVISSKPSQNDIVAVVNKIPITRDQLNQEINSRAKTDQPAGQLEKQCLEDLIDRLLVLQQWDDLARKGVNIPLKIIDERIDEITKSEFSGDREKFLKAISNNGYTLDNFRETEMVRIQIQVARQTGIKEMFRDSPAASPEEFKRQREEWMKKLRDRADIEIRLASNT